MDNFFEQYDNLYDDKITTEIIADSWLDQDQVRVTTMLLRIPRIMLPELTRHRCFSFSIQSSRARSNKTKAHSVHTDPFTPELAIADHRGMSGEVLLSDSAKKLGQNIWHLARQDMLTYAKQMFELGWSHQYTNRLLEPFMMVDVLVTGTEWNNFITLRDDSNAQFEIQVVARQVKELLELSSDVTNELEPGAWHLPFVGEEENHLSIVEQLLVSASRCARTSFIDPIGSTHTVKHNVSLAHKLLEHFHLSPFEHCVQNVGLDYRGLSGNLDGGIQFRKLIEHYDFNLEDVERWCETWE